MTHGGVEVQLHTFLTLALDGGKWSASRSCRYNPGEMIPGTQCIGRWVGPRAGVKVTEKNLLPLLGNKPRFFGRSARSLAIKGKKGKALPVTGRGGP
jgi:hypothetical protein